MVHRRLDARVALLALGMAATSSCVPGYVGIGTMLTVGPTVQLVEIGPGLWVVADQAQPIYFDAGYYWWWRGGTWMRSQHYDRDYVRVDSPVVPVRLRRMDHRRYRRYHAPAGARVRSVREPPTRGRDQRRDDEADKDRARGRGHDDADKQDRGRGRGHDDEHDRGRRGHD